MFLCQSIYYPCTEQEMENLSAEDQFEIIKRNHGYVNFCIPLLAALLHNYSFRERYNTKENWEQQVNSDGTRDEIGDLVRFFKMAEYQSRKPNCMVLLQTGTAMINKREQLSILMYCDDIETKLGSGVSIYYSQRDGLKTDLFINPSIRCEHDNISDPSESSKTASDVLSNE